MMIIGACTSMSDFHKQEKLLKKGMRSGVMVRHRNRHKTDTSMKKQGILTPCKERQEETGILANRLWLKGFGAIRHNNQRQEKSSILELVRMRSPVQIWVAAP